jgi:hypothetical protein
MIISTNDNDVKKALVVTPSFSKKLSIKFMS